MLSRFPRNRTEETHREDPLAQLFLHYIHLFTSQLPPTLLMLAEEAYSWLHSLLRFNFRKQNTGSFKNHCDSYVFYDNVILFTTTYILTNPSLIFFFYASLSFPLRSTSIWAFHPNRDIMIKVLMYSSVYFPHSHQLEPGKLDSCAAKTFFF